MAKTLHPKLAAHGAKVKAAHEHLSKTVPGFRQQPGHQQFRQVQQHVRSGKACK